MTAKHILLVSNTAFSLWNFRRDIIRDMVASGYRVTCIADDNDTIAQDICSLGVDYISAPISRSGMNPFVELSLFIQLWHEMRCIKPDMVVTYTIKPNTYIPIIARLLNIPCVAVVTGLGYAFLQNTLRASIARASLKFGLLAATRVWVLNKGDLEHITNSSATIRTKTDIVPGEGIDTDYFDDAAFPQKAGGKFVFLMIARALKDKGVIEYAEAARIIRSKYPQAVFQLLGGVDPGNPAAIAADELAKLCQGSGIEHLMPVSDVRPFIAVADVCVLPSYREGIPSALLEAASMRRPMIATDVAGCRDVVEEGINGFLVPAKSAIALVNAMEKMLNLDETSIQSMKEAARRTVCERFAKEIIIRHYQQILKAYTG